MIQSFPFYNKIEQVVPNFTWYVREGVQSHKVESESELIIRLKNWKVVQFSLKIVCYGPYIIIIHCITIFLGLNFQTKLVIGVNPVNPSKINTVHRFYCGNHFISKLVGRLHMIFFFYTVS